MPGGGCALCVGLVLWGPGVSGGAVLWVSRNPTGMEVGARGAKRGSRARFLCSQCRAVDARCLLGSAGPVPALPRATSVCLDPLLGVPHPTKRRGFTPKAQLLQRTGFLRAVQEFAQPKQVPELFPPPPIYPLAACRAVRAGGAGFRVIMVSPWGRAGALCLATDLWKFLSFISHPVTSN